MVAGTVGAVNAQRHPSDPVRQFEGEFEIHLTLAPRSGRDSQEPIRDWAERHGLKYTRIVLDRGRTPDQPMLTCRGAGTLTGQVAAAHRWAARLRGDGFHVTRVKIEAAPWNSGVPRTEAEAAVLPAHCYFEHHVKLLLPTEQQIAAVRALAEPHAAHVSRNARRAASDGAHERFVTQRCRAVGRPEARRRLDALLQALSEAACTVMEVEEEFVVHDDNPAVDAGWIAGDDGEAVPRVA
ncbi:hypothetical protein GCM10014715_71100 [Streptomyces spiralis]|uniref:Uncharacterized protein n=1 Tax=Streptomyces spiralis TaxID=66376 RepID=A0A919E2Q4_9ACTN|nr:hypothetical protein GCM10014715_71100 [Streptomyces spiralis]